MPAALRAAHDSLDGAVLRSYGLRAGASDDRVLTTLFARYAELTA